MTAGRAEAGLRILRFLAGTHSDRYTMTDMPGLGVHFALTDEETKRLLALEGNHPVTAFIEEIKAGDDHSRSFSSKMSWDALHRSLSNGTLFSDEGEYPLNRAILGGKHLYDAEEYVIAYVAANEVKDVAAALAPLTEQDLRTRYDLIDPDEYDGKHGGEDFQGILEGFRGLRSFYKKAAADGRSVVFTVAQ